MKLYLDTGNLEDIKKGLESGVVDGVTTNPTLIAKENVKFETRIKQIAAAFRKAKVKDFTVSAEVTTLTAKEMVKQALPLAKIDKNVLVKIPLTPEGIKATHELAQRKIRVNVTLCFSASQALLAAKAGAYVVSPFVGRLDDTGTRGMDLIEQIRHIYDTYGFETKILAASIRHTMHVIEAAEAGADIATLPFNVFEKLFQHPLTDSGLEKFMEDGKAQQ